MTSAIFQTYNLVQGSANYCLWANLSMLSHLFTIFSCFSAIESMWLTKLKIFTLCSFTEKVYQSLILVHQFPGWSGAPHQRLSGDPCGQSCCHC